MAKKYDVFFNIKRNKVTLEKNTLFSILIKIAFSPINYKLPISVKVFQACSLFFFVNTKWNVFSKIHYKRTYIILNNS